MNFRDGARRVKLLTRDEARRIAANIANDGNVIGVNTAIFSPSGGSVGIAFAIPSETVKTVVAQLRDKGTVTRGWIGVQIQPVTPRSPTASA
jgi:S1-C subfamily serine protease